MNNATRQCPFCGGDIQPGTGQCSQCTFDMHAGPAPRTLEHHADYGLILLAIPVVSTLLIWFWVGSMSLFQSPGSTLGLILIATSLGTAAVAAYEASKARLHTNPEIRLYSPTACFFLITLPWGIGYPLYLYKRKYAGLANRLIPKATTYIWERIWSKDQKITDLSDGGITLTFTATSRPEVLAWVLSFGGEATLREPYDIREEIRKRLQIMSEAHQ